MNNGPSQRWFSKNKGRLMAFLALFGFQILLFYLFGSLFLWYFFNQRPIVLMSLVVILGCDVILFGWMLKDIERKTLTAFSIFAIFILVLCSCLSYGAFDVLTQLMQNFLVDSLSVQDRSFYLVLVYELDTPAYYVIYDCNILGNSCIRHRSALAEAIYPGGDNNIVAPAKPTSLIVVPASGRIGVLEDGKIIDEYLSPKSSP